MTARFRFATLLLLTPAMPLTGYAQSTVSGTVRADSTGALLAGVEVLLEGSSQMVRTDASGRYLLPGLPVGTQVILFRLVGYQPFRASILLRAGDTAQFEARLVRQSVQQLDSVTVRGAPSTVGVGIGREAFEERRSRGFGRFIDTAEMRRSEQRKLSDMLRGMQGVSVIRYRHCLSPPNRHCDPIEERAGSARGITSMNPRAGLEYCWMSVWLDGRVLYLSGSSMKVPDFGRDFRPQELDMVEVYRRAGETPGEYSGSSAACGTILLWSKRAP